MNVEQNDFKFVLFILVSISKWRSNNCYREDLLEFCLQDRAGQTENWNINYLELVFVRLMQKQGNLIILKHILWMRKLRKNLVCSSAVCLPEGGQQIGINTVSSLNCNTLWKRMEVWSAPLNISLNYVFEWWFSETELNG